VTAGQPKVVALVTHARSVPVAWRERFAAAAREAGPGGVLLVQTCHRVEAYAPGGSAHVAKLAAALPPGGRVLEGEVAVRHGMAVAVGRDSVVVGEDQILHQLRSSIAEARDAGSLHPTLERLFTIALRAGRRARSWDGGPRRSLADLAVTTIERHLGPLARRNVLTVGTGQIGRLGVAAGLRAGAKVAVASRTPEAANALAASTGARTETFDPGARVDDYDAVLVALAGPWTIAPTTIYSLGRGTTIVVDLSVPVAIPDVLGELLGTRLVTADDLARLDADDDDRPVRRDRVDALIDEATREFLTWDAGRDRRAAAHALVERADLARQVELAALWRRLPDLDAETRAAIERMTQHLADRLLKEPLERLGRDRDGRDERAARELFAL
jgi:glutamyl-tRNA reductase